MPFVPHPAIAGGHLQTIVSYYLPQIKTLNPHTTHRVDLGDGDKLALLENKPSRKAALKKAVLFMHGLGGHDASPYMLRLTSLFKNRGWRVFRMNHRGCGAGKGLARGVYHSGRSDDISKVLTFIAQTYPDTPLVAAGFSLSGNALLKLLGENAHPVPSNLVGAVAVTPPIDLAGCSDALCRRSNRIYEWRFLRLLKASMRERRQAFADFPELEYPSNMSIRDFDEYVTAPLGGFASAADYYRRCSARQFLAGIKTPTILLASLNDPFIPARTFANIQPNGFLQLQLTDSGGHMGYIAKHKTPIDSYRWMDYAVLTFAENFFR